MGMPNKGLTKTPVFRVSEDTHLFLMRECGLQRWSTLTSYLRDLLNRAMTAYNENPEGLEKIIKEYGVNKRSSSPELVKCVPQITISEDLEAWLQHLTDAERKKNCISSVLRAIIISKQRGLW